MPLHNPWWLLRMLKERQGCQCKGPAVEQCDVKIMAARPVQHRLTRVLASMLASSSASTLIILARP